MHGRVTRGAGPTLEWAKLNYEITENDAHCFYQGRRLGYLEGRVAHMQEEIDRLQGQIAPLGRKLYAIRITQAPEFRWKVWFPFSGDTSLGEH